MNNYPRHIVYFLLTLFVLSCGKKESTVEQVVEGLSPYDTIALPKLSNLKPRLRLTTEAQSTTKNWNFYQELSQTLDSLGRGTIGQTKKYVTQLDKTYANLKESEEASVNSTPNELNTQAVRARLAALETQIRVLKNEVDKNEPSVDRIAASIVRSKNALQDLNLQIDERFALSIEEMLKAANEVTDSITTTQTERPSPSRQ